MNPFLQIFAPGLLEPLFYKIFNRFYIVPGDAFNLFDGGCIGGTEGCIQLQLSFFHVCR